MPKAASPPSLLMDPFGNFTECSERQICRSESDFQSRPRKAPSSSPTFGELSLFFHLLVVLVDSLDFQ